MSKKSYKNRLNTISNIKEDIVKEELPIEIIEAVISPENNIVQEVTDTAPAP